MTTLSEWQSFTVLEITIVRSLTSRVGPITKASQSVRRHYKVHVSVSFMLLAGYFVCLSYGACKSLKDHVGKDSVELALERKEIRIMKMLKS